MDELEALGLDARHRRALERMGITSWLELVLEERAVILKAMSRIRPPRPTIDDVTGWQDEARKQMKSAGGAPTARDASGPQWEPVASFAVNFERRDGERQLAVGQAEVEDTPPQQVWPNWDCVEACRWMHRVATEAASAEPASAAVGEPQAARPRGGQVPTERSAITVEDVLLIDEAGETEMPAHPEAVGAPIGIGEDARLRVTLRIPEPGLKVYVTARVRLPSGDGMNLVEPVTVPETNQVELPLDRLTPGIHAVRILAWTEAPHGRAPHGRRNLPALERPER
jgi:hypothetical protein